MARMFEVIVLMSYLTQLAAAAPTCNYPSVSHTNDTYSRCCQAIICPPGSEPKICGSEDTPASCKLCPDGRFNDMYLSSSGKMESCKLFTECEAKYQMAVGGGNATHDRICDCKNGDLLGADKKCYDPCPPGKYWLKNESDCFPCRNGTFKDTEGGQECSLCTSCNTTATACSPANDAVCVRDVNEKPSQESETKFPEGGIAAIVVPLVIIIIVVAVLVALCICRRRRKTCSSLPRSASSSNPAPSSGPNGTAPGTDEEVALTVSGSANADNNDPSPSSRQSQSTHGFSRCLAKYCCCEQSSRSSAVVVRLESNGPDATTPLNPSSSEQTDDEIRQSDSPSGGNNGRLDHNQLEGGGTTGTHTITIPPTTPITQADNCNGHPPADVSPSVGSGVQSSGDGSSPDGPPPGGSGGQPASVNSNEGQPSGVAARCDPANSGDRGSGEDQGPRSVNGSASLCTGTFNQSLGDRPMSQVAPNSFNPPTTDRRDSGPSAIQDTSIIDLRIDAPAGESVVKKYVRVMQENHVEALTVLQLGVTFIGYLYQEHILTPDQYGDILILKKQVGGKPEVFRIIQDALLRSGDKAAKPFLSALIHPDSRQDALAMLIDPERAAELIRKRDDPDEALSPESVKSRNSVEEHSRVPLLSMRSVDQDIVDHSKPAETVPTETPVKTVDTGEAWVDPAVPASKC